MRAIVAFAVLAVIGCHPSQSGKSLFAVGPADFKTHKSETLTGTQSTSACNDVAQGDIMFFTASGSLTTTLGTVGPNGQSWGGVSFALVNRPAWGLFGALGDSHFLVGEQLAMIAPRSGCLTTMVNGCQALPAMDGGLGGFDCSTTGAFTVDTYSHLDDGVTIATVPPVSDNSISNSSTVTVDAARDWQSTGITVARGEKVFVSATGQVTTSNAPFGGVATYDADGAAGWIGGTAFLLDARQCYRLFGEIGDTVIDLGKTTVFLAPAAGELKLAVNHYNGATTGSLSVAVGHGVVPARGLLEEDAQGFTQSATVTVNPDGNWLATGVTVHKGDPMVISASGQLTVGSASPVGPNGVGSIGGFPYPVPGKPLYALFGKVGDEPIFFGDANVVLAPADGEVQLLINQTNWCALGKICSPNDAGIIDVPFPPDCVTADYCAAYGTATGSFSATVRAP